MLRREEDGRSAEARNLVESFHVRLCSTRVLDPACGTANFLYVALEMMKRLEGEVLEVLSSLGGQESLPNLDRQSVGPHQFLGLEINRRAAAIAELVLWIGHLQGQMRAHVGEWTPPILKDLGNIKGREGDGDALIVSVEDPRRTPWPEAEFIVGNPPFLGGKDLRGRLGDAYTAALRRAQPQVPESADLVMSWWDHAAELLVRPGTALRRFGFVTTNSISQVFQRRVTERHLAGGAPMSIVVAVPDHPWTRAASDAAAVRIAMTVCEAGSRPGLLREVVAEAGLDGDAPILEFAERKGTINADLTVGVDIARSAKLKANAGLCHDGVKLHGSGFLIAKDEAIRLGLHRRPGLDRHIRPYRNGRDLAARCRDLMVIDLFGLSDRDVFERFPEIYQHLLQTVRPARDREAARSGGRDAQAYAEKWWIFGKPRQELRPALVALDRFIATVDTARHRLFQFIPAGTVCDDKNVLIAASDPVCLGVLSSRIHVLWSQRAGGWLGIGNDSVYTKTRTLDPFPFPAPDDLQRRRIGALAEDLDAHRKRVADAHPHLTLTGLYNVRDALRRGARPGDLAPAERRTFDDGLVLILDDLHDRLDRAVADAYGWPQGLADEEVLERLVALNRARGDEEARGLVRWLRPDYQVPRFGSAEERRELALGEPTPRKTPAPAGKPLYPADDVAQTAVVMAALMRASGALDAGSIASGFRQGRRVAPRVAAVLLSLYRMGLVGTADGGASFVLQRLG